MKSTKVICTQAIEYLNGETIAYASPLYVPFDWRRSHLWDNFI
ncbi:hypothetical protein SLEP1_g60002 [Rubroshorea leprosula]|uniref:Uncharacterized protein n=1 Tax=Rubroshorea leprosula TaxID=152421 RepID=A0AAV5MVD0_9ROSI|nr:hypothetical protein SLEP1_g60002 [Rubroshorea leprosula]